MILKLEDSLTYKISIAMRFWVGEKTKEERYADLSDFPHMTHIEETAGSAGMILRILYWIYVCRKMKKTSIKKNK